MLKFRKIKLQDKALVEKYYKRVNHFICDYCFTDMFMWAHNYHTQICEQDGYLYCQAQDEDLKYFLPPIPENDELPMKPAIDNMLEYARALDIPFMIVAVPDSIKEKLENEMPNTFSFEMSRSNQDYVYTAESLITLKGKKLHGKRNHINKFMSEYGDQWTYEDLNDDNVRDFFKYQLEWSDLDNTFMGELEASAIALKNDKVLGIVGGILRLNGKIIGITFGTKAFDDTYIIQIEKANYDIPGAYQMINQQFAIHNCQDVTYIDREEDLGIEGLRKAKESYYPAFLGSSYTGRLL